MFAYSYPPCVVGIEGQWNQVQYRWGDIETFGSGVERGRLAGESKDCRSDIIKS